MCEMLKVSYQPSSLSKHSSGTWFLGSPSFSDSVCTSIQDPQVLSITLQISSVGSLFASNLRILYLKLLIISVNLHSRLHISIKTVFNILFKIECLHCVTTCVYLWTKGGQAITMIENCLHIHVLSRHVLHSQP